jgi:hypothetical protein
MPTRRRSEGHRARSRSRRARQRWSFRPPAPSSRAPAAASPPSDRLAPPPVHGQHHPILGNQLPLAINQPYPCPRPARPGTVLPSAPFCVDQPLFPGGAKRRGRRAQRRPARPQGFRWSARQYPTGGAGGCSPGPAADIHGSPDRRTSRSPVHTPRPPRRAFLAGHAGAQRGPNTAGTSARIPG